jgi:flagellar biogenesis protein FliO
MGLLILTLIPLSVALLILNCVSWVVTRLRTSGLPVRMGAGWPWLYYTWAVNKVGPSEWDYSALLLDMAVALAILLATAGLVLLLTRRGEKGGWQ